jgi:CubicO group peptidase (beta-lactamase class C family)
MRLVSSILALAVLSKCLLALCPPTGPVLPPPLLTSNTWNTKSIDDVVSSFELSSRKELKTTFFSVSVTSTENTIFSYHYTPKTYNSSGTHNATGSSPQRVASITKLFTVLAVLLQDGMNLDDPIARYIPELATQQRWQAVTLRMLAGQHGGVARDGRYMTSRTTMP